MPLWQPKAIWPGQDAFIIGGGPSLKDFNWTRLHRENTVGCNNAFRLGPDVCKVCVFCDDRFILLPTGEPRPGFYDELAKFPGLVITNSGALCHRKEPWLYWMPRKGLGLHRDALGYNFNTGAAAINVALLLGATTIYLLGFDMHLGPSGEPNYHQHVIDPPSNEVYGRMIENFIFVDHALRDKFPGCQVFNVNRDSRLSVFPMLDPDEFWATRTKEKKSCGNVH